MDEIGRTFSGSLEFRSLVSLDDKTYLESALYIPSVILMRRCTESLVGNRLALTIILMDRILSLH